MKRVLLTGGIGSGKSTVGRMLADRGATVIDADRVGHLVLEEEAREAVARRWPEAVEEGRLDRSALAEIVFADSAQLAELEALTHPPIARRILEMVGEVEGVAVVELPVAKDLLGPGWLRVVVDAPAEIRLARLRERGMQEERARRRMAVQPSSARWRETADVVIDNSGGLDDLERQVDRLWERLKGCDAGAE